MSNNSVIHLGENSPEYIAYRLLQDISIKIENRSGRQIDRKQYLDTYAECLQAVRGFRDFRDQD